MLLVCLEKSSPSFVLDIRFNWSIFFQMFEWLYCKTIKKTLPGITAASSYLLFSFDRVVAVHLVWETSYFHKRWNTLEMSRPSWSYHKKAAIFLKQQDHRNLHVPKNYPLHLMHIPVKHVSIFNCSYKKCCHKETSASSEHYKYVTWRLLIV